jgi:hypothetical protein
MLCVFMMWWVNLPCTIRIMDAQSSLLRTFTKKIVKHSRHHENVPSHLLATFMVEAADLNGFRLRSSKASRKLKGQVIII